MDKELVKKENGILSQLTESACETDLQFKYDISYSLCGTNIPLVRIIPFQTECCSDEELKSKVLMEVLKHLNRNGIIGFVTVLIKDENRTIDVI